MTFQEIVTMVAERLDLSSPAALDRIGREVNERYKWLVSSVGLVTSVRTVVTAATIIGNRYVTFTNTTKILSVFTGTTPNIQVLGEISFDEMRNLSVGTSDPAQQYAIARIGAKDVTIILDSIPQSIYAISGDAKAPVGTLATTDVPSFSENYHDILVYGAMATEYDKMDKPALAQKQEMMFMQRVSDLRLEIAVSAYKDIYQGKSSWDWPNFGMINQ